MKQIKNNFYIINNEFLGKTRFLLLYVDGWCVLNSSSLLKKKQQKTYTQKIVSKINCDVKSILCILLFIRQKLFSCLLLWDIGGEKNAPTKMGIEKWSFSYIYIFFLILNILNFILNCFTFSNKTRIPFFGVSVFIWIYLC